MRWALTLPLLLWVLTAVGCREARTTAPTPPAAPPETASEAPPLHLNRAQPPLPKIRLWVGGHELDAEVATTMPQLATGMMFRTNLAENAGMLFVFGQPHRASFYMKNTIVPLSAAYVDPEGVILELHDLEPLKEDPVPAGSDQVQYVLEVNRGWFVRHGVSTGAVLRTPTGSLAETFFRRRP